MGKQRQNRDGAYLRSSSPKDDALADDGFPFSLPVIQNLRELRFATPVTFFVGENGSGKSTLLEAIAAGMKSVAIGSEDVAHDQTLRHARRLADAMTFVRGQNPGRGSYFHAEDAFGFTKRVGRMMEEFDQLAEQYDRDLEGVSRRDRVGMARGQRAALAARYGDNPDAMSHGESFLNVFRQRCVPGGLYLLDEPETPLSPLRQLALLSHIKQKVAEDSQFIIAAHSPILMALPGATILGFDGDTIAPTAYDDVEHVSLTRAFLNDPDAFCRRL